MICSRPALSPSSASSAIPASQPSDPALALLDGAAGLHDDAGPGQVGAMAVLALERACGGAAAAMFEWFDEVGVLGLCAAGPRWRTAERERPAWLACRSGALALLVQSATADAGTRPDPTIREDPAAAHVIAVPVPLAAGPRTTLVTVWPGPAPPSGEIAEVIAAFARHVARALDRPEVAAGRPMPGRAPTCAAP